MKTPAILKRKKMGVTDYRKRLSLLRSESTRLIIRPTGKGIVVQVADFAQEGDIILATVNANILKKTLGISGNNSQISYISGYYLVFLVPFTEPGPRLLSFESCLILFFSLALEFPFFCFT